MPYRKLAASQLDACQRTPEALIEKVVLTPGEKRGEVKAELYGELGALLALGEAARKSRTSLSEVRLSVVAGAGYQLCLLVVAYGLPLIRLR